MGRPIKYGLEYFNIDCIQEDNLNYVEALHGLMGYGIVIKLWRKIYMINGYYAEFSEKHRRMFCKDIGVTYEELMKVVDTCFKEGMFSTELYQKYEILTGSGPQKRWLKIVKEANRKNCVIDEKYLISEFTPRKTELSGEETQVNSEFSAQSKVKESKGKKTKVNTVAQAKPARPKKGVKEVKEVEQPLPEPHWQQLVECWFVFHTDRKLEPPSFKGRDPKFFKDLLQLLKKRAALKKLEWSEAVAKESLNSFLTTGFEDKWLQKHFTLKNLLEQFDAIRNRALVENAPKASQNKPQTLSAAPAGNNPMAELKYYFGRFLENQLVPELLNPEMYDLIVSRNLVPVGYKNPYPGTPMSDEHKRNAVIEFFNQQKINNGKESHEPVSSAVA